MEPMQALTAVNAAFTLYEKAKNLLKDLTGKLPASAGKDEAAKDLAQAEEAIQIARVELAKALGYPLCQRHFPPGIKLDVRVDAFPRWKCSDCGDVTPHSTRQRPPRQSFVKNY